MQKIETELYDLLNMIGFRQSNENFEVKTCANQTTVDQLLML